MWVLKHFGCSSNNEAVTGDLVERYQHRRSHAWFWKQVIVAVCHEFYSAASSNKLLAFQAIVVGLGANALSQLLVFRLAFLFGFGATGSLSWFFVYRPLVAAIVCGGFAGRVAAASGRQHRKLALLSYALITTIIVVGQFIALVLFVGPNIREGERVFFILPLALSLLHIPAVLIGGLWGASPKIADLEERS